MKYTTIIAVLIALVNTEARSQELNSSRRFIGALEAIDEIAKKDIHSYEVLTAWMDQNKITRKEIENDRIDLSKKDPVLELAHSRSLQPSLKKRTQLLGFLSFGIGSIYNQSFSAMVIGTNTNSKPTWYVQAALSELDQTWGKSPDNVSISVGMFPLKRKWMAIGLRIEDPIFTNTLGIGPELLATAAIGKKQRIRIHTQFHAPVFIGEPGLKSDHFSVLPEIQIGVSLRVFKTGKP